MSDPTQPVPEPGWYDDPTGEVAGQKRWWSGEGWTSFTEIPPVVSPAVAPAVSVASFAQAPASVAAEPVGDLPPLADGYEPMSMRRFETTTYRDIPSRWSTASVWFIALTPLLYFVALAWIVTVAWASNFNLFVVLAALLVPQLLVIAWAYRDRARLDSFGFDDPAHWAWILLGPLAYLIARTVATYRAARIGAAPLWTYVAINVALTGLTIAIAIFAPSVVPNP